MSVRRGTTRFATVFTLLTGLLVGSAAPAMADGDRMQIRAASSFTAGDSPGSVTLAITRRADGCVSVRTALGIRLTGLSAEQVQVQVASDGDWRPVSVSTGGDGLLVTERTAPDKERLCHHKTVGARYRLAFLSGAPGGSATIVGAAYADGAVIASANVTRRVVGGRVPSPTESPSPSLTADPAVVPQGPTQSQVAAAPAGQQSGGGSFGIGTLVMLIGVAMVGIGIALLVFLIRRSRAEDGVPPAVGPFSPGSGAATLPNAAVPGGDGSQTMVLPRGGALPGSGGPGSVGPGGTDGPPTLILPRWPD